MLLELGAGDHQEVDRDVKLDTSRGSIVDDEEEETEKEDDWKRERFTPRVRRAHEIIVKKKWRGISKCVY